MFQMVRVRRRVNEAAQDQVMGFDGFARRGQAMAAFERECREQAELIRAGLLVVKVRQL